MNVFLVRKTNFFVSQMQAKKLNIARENATSAELIKTAPRSPLLSKNITTPRSKPRGAETANETKAAQRETITAKAEA